MAILDASRNNPNLGSVSQNILLIGQYREIILDFGKSVLAKFVLKRCIIEGKKEE